MTWTWSAQSSGRPSTFTSARSATSTRPVPAARATPGHVAARTSRGVGLVERVEQMGGHAPYPATDQAGIVADDVAVAARGRRREP